jgi:acetyl esterase/lipase
LPTQNIEELKKMPVLYRIEGQEKAKVQKDIVYKKVGKKELKLDIYSPAKREKNILLPAVIFISGAGEMKNWRFFEDYGALTAANGMISIQYDKRKGIGDVGIDTALEDTSDLIEFVREDAAKYGIDKDFLAVWSFSGGGFVLKSAMLPDQQFIRCLVAFYGIGEGEREQMKKMGDKLPPILIVRAGLDNILINEKSINQRIDLFIKDAIAKNLRLELINYSEGKHAFDLFDDKPETREIIRKTFEFIKDQMNFKR